MKTEKYKKCKMFKSSLRVYYIEIEIIKRYSVDKSKITLNLYTHDKKEHLDCKTTYITNYHDNIDLDNCSKEFIYEYEDWKDVDNFEEYKEVLDVVDSFQRQKIVRDKY